MAIVTFIPNLKAISRYCFDWDAAQLALGTVEFSLSAHQPHPPGYPLWVWVVSQLGVLLGSVPLAQTFVGAAFILAGIVILVINISGRTGRAVAVGLGALLFSVGPVRLYTVAQSTYPVDFFASALLGILSYKGWRGSQGAALIAWPLAALLAGFRPSGVMLLLPLMLFSTIRARGGGGFRAAGIGLVLFAVVGSSWLYPLVAGAGGIKQYFQITSELFRNTAGATSPILGVGFSTSLRIGIRFLVILGATVAPFLFWVMGGRRTTASPLWLYLFWCIPSLIFNGLVHFAKPGYLLILLPPIFWYASMLRPRKGAIALGVVLGAMFAQYPWSGIDNRIGRALATQSPHVAIDAAVANEELAKAINNLKPSRLDCPSDFRRDAPNERTIDFDFRYLSGDPSRVLKMSYSPDEIPLGAETAFEGSNFLLWWEAN